MTLKEKDNMSNNNDTQHVSVTCLAGTIHCVKSFTFFILILISFHSHRNPVKMMDFYTHSTDENTGAQSDLE